MKGAAHTQCLIIGSGIAGLAAAIALDDAGIETVVISSAPSLTESNTVHAQGGIIYEPPHAPNPELLIHDILEAGCHVNYAPAVRQLVELGPRLVQRVLLEKASVSFDRGSSNEYHLTREAAHSESRILHRGDESGRSIQESLAAYCRERPTLGFRLDTTAVNLLMTSYHSTDRSRRHEEARCFGAFVFDQASGTVYPIFAPHTLIATGGVGQLYLHDTNSKYSRGDGIALAHRAGCRMENLEYLQFHPTTFFHPASRRFLISEALRGEGAVLLNQAGERFMQRYLPEYETPELAPRDKVAKAIQQEMLSSGTPCVYLDISHKQTAWIQERFPFVHRSCARFGVDITREPIPVVPGAHYHCGGIWTGLDGHTSIPGVWAAGEVACTGVHGANRLASTSLLEGLVWGTRAGETIGDLAKHEARFDPPAIEAWKDESAHVDPAFLSQDWLTLKHTMWNYVGLIKTEARLKRAQGILTELTRGIDVFYRKAALSDALIGLRHASLAATLILRACLKNPRSLGCYQREEIEICKAMDLEAIRKLEALPESEAIRRILALKRQHGPDLCLLAHLYQRKRITELADFVGDSYGLSRSASMAKGRYIVFAGVRFMAESAAILSRPDQIVLHPDPEAGCPMADMASMEEVTRAWDVLRPGGAIVPVTYMNSTANLKAFCGERGGTICTSSNALKTFEWAFLQAPRIFFLPDEHLGRNTALKFGIQPEDIAVWDPEKPDGGDPDAYESARVILWRGYCPVHQKFTVRDIEHVRRFYPQSRIVVHPECPREVVEKADASGSTEFIRKYVAESKPGDQIFIGTEINLVQNLAQQYPDRLIAKLHRSLCLTMYQITLGRLLYTLENLHSFERVEVPESVRHFSRVALDRMLSLPM